MLGVGKAKDIEETAALTKWMQSNIDPELKAKRSQERKNLLKGKGDIVQEAKDNVDKEEKAGQSSPISPVIKILISS